MCIVLTVSLTLILFLPRSQPWRKGVRYYTCLPEWISTSSISSLLFVCALRISAFGPPGDSSCAMPNVAEPNELTATVDQYDPGNTRD